MESDARNTMRTSRVLLPMNFPEPSSFPSHVDVGGPVGGPAGGHAGGASELVHLSPDHPGFRDEIYRRRRNEIAALALAYRAGDPVPDVRYSEVEQEVWRMIRERLDPLHEECACRAYREAASLVRLDRVRIPQLSEVNARIRPILGFSMLPVAGLVSARTFLEYLGRDVFLSTQYMRHHSRPLYTPEPDVVHELVGHAATFASPEFVALNRAFGRAAVHAREEGARRRIDRLYWFTMEFGVVEEDGGTKAVGAGLLSSFGELERFRDGAELVPFDVDEIVETPYDPTGYQGRLFVAPSFESLALSVIARLERP
jgi:phenylalanine-4-hydroxylase